MGLLGVNLLECDCTSNNATQLLPPPPSTWAPRESQRCRSLYMRQWVWISLQCIQGVTSYCLGKSTQVYIVPWRASSEISDYLPGCIYVHSVPKGHIYITLHYITLHYIHYIIYITLKWYQGISISIEIPGYFYGVRICLKLDDSSRTRVNPYNPGIFVYKPWRPKGYFHLKL